VTLFVTFDLYSTGVPTVIQGPWIFEYSHKPYITGNQIHWPTFCR